MPVRLLSILLDNPSNLSFLTICKLLNLEYYTEDTTITISGINFVLDIFESLTCTFSFVDEKLTTNFLHVEKYLNICLKNKQIKIFTYLLEYFILIDKCQINSTMLNSNEMNPHCSLKKFDGLWICNCIFTDALIVLPFADIVMKGPEYNIFTHRVEVSTLIFNTLFIFPFDGTKINVFGLIISKEMWNDFQQELVYDYKFFSLVDENSAIKDDLIFYEKSDMKFCIDKKLNFKILNLRDEGKEIVATFLLKRGVCLKNVLSYVGL